MTPIGLVFVGLSVDGFIAREDHSLDWLTGGAEPGEPPPEDMGFQPFFDSVDALVIGRGTYDVVLGFPGWYYGAKPVYVLTSRPLELPSAPEARVEAVSGSPRQVMERLGERGHERLYIDGGKTIQAFLAEGLIHRMVLTRVPVLIGRGIPLFGPVPGDIRLRHVDTRTFAGGAVQTEYEVVAGADAGP